MRAVLLLWLTATLVLAGCDPAGQSRSAQSSAETPHDGPAPPPRAFTAVVERVVDGDTIVARRGGRSLRVRLIGVDAPESVVPGQPVECFGPQAGEVLAGLLGPGQRVQAAYQPGGRRDRFDRELWDVWLADGRFVQGVLVRRGAAQAYAYRPQVAHADHLAAVEDRARAAGRGLHGACDG